MELISRFFDSLGLTEIIGGPEALLAGLHQVQADLLRVGLDVQTAKARGCRLSKAAQDFDNYPYLARMHTTMDDMLRWSLPPALAAWARRCFLEPPPPIADELRTYLVDMAASDPNPVRRAMCEWGLFECVRMNLTIRVHLYPEETSMIGVESDDLREIAEQTVATWLRPPVLPTDGIRPFHVIVAAALAALDDHGQDLRQAMLLVHNDYREQVERQARLDQLLSELDAADAVLIRNDLAKGLGEPHLSVELLQKRHPLVLGDRDRNTLDQRTSRTRKKLLKGGVQAARRKTSALLDIIKETEGPSDTKRRS